MSRCCLPSTKQTSRILTQTTTLPCEGQKTKRTPPPHKFKHFTNLTFDLQKENCMSNLKSSFRKCVQDCVYKTLFKRVIGGTIGGHFAVLWRGVTIVTIAVTYFPRSFLFNTFKFRNNQHFSISSTLNLFEHSYCKTCRLSCNP